MQKRLVRLIDFEPLREAGLREILSVRPDLLVESTDLAGAFRHEAVDLGVFALRSGADSLGLLARLRGRHPEMKLVVVGCDGSDIAILEVISTGARGWVEDTASPEEVLQAIDMVLHGSVWAPPRVLSILVERAISHSVPTSTLSRKGIRLTERESEVLEHLVLARSNREIAQALRLREQTVKAYVSRLMKKAGVENRTALSIEATEGGWWKRKTA